MTVGHTMRIAVWVIALVAIAGPRVAHAQRRRSGCCFDDVPCQVVTMDECAAMGGDYRGDGTNCFACTGACCVSVAGICTQRESYQCTGNNIFHGAGVSCVDVSCPFGACCQPSGECRFTLESACDGVGGVFQGVGEDCDSAGCEPFGACCLNDGTCLPDTPEGACGTLGGSFSGPGAQCDASTCLGGCCLVDEPCVEVSIHACTSMGGAFLGIGTDCFACEGGCCTTTGICSDRQEYQCTTGIFAGVGFPLCGDHLRLRCLLPPDRHVLHQARDDLRRTWRDLPRRRHGLRRRPILEFGALLPGRRHVPSGNARRRLCAAMGGTHGGAGLAGANAACLDELLPR